MVKREGQLMHRRGPWKVKEKGGEKRKKSRPVMYCSWWVKDVRERRIKRELKSKQVGRERKKSEWWTKRESYIMYVCGEKEVFFYIGRNKR